MVPYISTTHGCAVCLLSAAMLAFPRKHCAKHGVSRQCKKDDVQMLKGLRAANIVLPILIHQYAEGCDSPTQHRKLQHVMRTL